MIVVHSERGPTSTVTAATEIWYLRPPSKPLRITWVSERLTLRLGFVLIRRRRATHTHVCVIL